MVAAVQARAIGGQEEQHTEQAALYTSESSECVMEKGSTKEGEYERDEFNK